MTLFRCRQDRAHQEGPPTFNLQTVPGEVGRHIKSLLKRAAGTKSCTILVRNWKRDSSVNPKTNKGE